MMHSFLRNRLGPFQAAFNSCILGLVKLAPNRSELFWPILKSRRK